MMSPAVRMLPLALLLCVCAPGLARGQSPQPQTVVRLPDAIVTVKHHASFMVSGGFDLDVLGNVVSSALGARDGEQIAIRSARPWPDVYVAVPKRAALVAGYGLFHKDEIVARFSRTTYQSEPLADAGNVVGAGGDEPLTLTFSPYRERSVEIGWRRYMALTKRMKEYANFMYGVRTVDPIDAAFSTATAELGERRMYDKGTTKSFSLEIGFTFEAGHTGLFAEFGGRWQQKLPRTNDSLAEWGLDTANDTGLRFYMPLQFGVLFRL